MLSQRLFLVLTLASMAAKADCFHSLRTPFDSSVHRRNTIRPPVVKGSNFLGFTKNNALFASTDEPVSEGRSEVQKTRSINELLSELGSSFKSRAEENMKKSKEGTTKTRSFLFAVMSSAYFMMFLFYRAYRGFFVLLPAVFRRVYSRLETAVETDLSLENGQENPSSVQSPSWKTKVTVSVLATVVTCSYIIGGASRIVGKFFRTVGKTSSVSESFGAAAKEAVDHEDRIRRRMSLSEDGEEAPRKPSSTNDHFSP